jgi:hypothetical protein
MTCSWRWFIHPETAISKNRNGSSTLCVFKTHYRDRRSSSEISHLHADPVFGPYGIWNLAEIHFPGAVQIVDLYHARQHLWELARKLYPNDDVSQKAWIKAHQKRLLDKGKIEKLVVAIRSIHSANPEVADKIRTEAEYFERNAERMRYPHSGASTCLSAPA